MYILQKFAGRGLITCVCRVAALKNLPIYSMTRIRLMTAIIANNNENNLVIIPPSRPWL